MTADKEKKKRKRYNKRKVTFDEEIVTKNDANLLLKNANDVEKKIEKVETKTKKKKRKNDANDSTTISQTQNEVPKKKAKRLKVIEPKEEAESENVVTEELDPTKPEIKKVESIRERKRKKYKDLIEQKRLKNEENMQKQCLNYISKWKHARDSWKFEKLKQIWIQKHIHDNVMIPNEFWNLVLEYFNNGKGKTRDMLLKDSLKIVEEVDSAKDEDIPEEKKLKYNRAREIIQHLQE